MTGPIDTSFAEHVSFRAPDCITCNKLMSSLGVKSGYNLWDCKECGYLTVWPLPSQELLSEFYNASYFLGNKEGGGFGYEDILSNGYREATIKYSVIRLRILKGLLGDAGQILDFGCGSGVFLEVARAHGWRARGIELNPEMRDRLRQQLGLEIVAHWSDLTGQVDAVTMWEALEHMLDPLDSLLGAREHIRVGGVIALSFPNLGCSTYVRNGITWQQIKPPEHLHDWTPKGIRLLLERAGFKVAGYRFHGPCWAIDGRLHLGSRSNPRTILWPVMSVIGMMFGRRQMTELLENPNPRLSRWYQGMEVYAVKNQ